MQQHVLRHSQCERERPQAVLEHARALLLLLVLLDLRLKVLHENFILSYETVLVWEDSYYLPNFSKETASAALESLPRVSDYMKKEHP